jgi:hypothetical protein
VTASDSTKLTTNSHALPLGQHTFTTRAVVKLFVDVRITIKAKQTPTVWAAHDDAGLDCLIAIAAWAEVCRAAIAVHTRRHLQGARLAVVFGAATLQSAPNSRKSSGQICSAKPSHNKHAMSSKTKPHDARVGLISQGNNWSNGNPGRCENGTRQQMLLVSARTHGATQAHPWDDRMKSIIEAPSEKKTRGRPSSCLLTDLI